MNHRQLNHGCAGQDRLFPVQAQPPVPLQPRKRPLHHPALGQQHEPLGPRGAAHHLEFVVGVALHPGRQVVVVVVLVRPQPPQAREVLPAHCSSTCGATSPSSALAAVTTTASSRPSVSTAMCRLRPLTFLCTSTPRCSPPSLVATDWLSMLPALGGGLRCSWQRTSLRRTS